jgi:hypothetical protein
MHRYTRTKDKKLSKVISHLEAYFTFENEADTLRGNYD